MQVKKFEAPTMQEALKLVKTELGPEAIILSTKNHRKGFGLLSKPSVEVTAAVSEKTLVKKKMTEKLVAPEVKEQIDRMPAHRQTDIFNKFSNYITRRKEERQGAAQAAAVDSSKQRYVDIQDEGDEAQASNGSGYQRNGRAAAAKAVQPTPTAQTPVSRLSSLTVNEVPRVSVQNGQEYLQFSNPVAADSESIKMLQSEISRLKEMMVEMKTENVVDQRMNEMFSAEIQNEYQNLVTAGVERKYALELIRETAYALDSNTKASTNREKVVESIAHEMMKNLKVENPIESMHPRSEQRVIAFVGPTGVGKTTTIAKLASQAILKQNLRVGLINLDFYKIAALDQLSTYAKILNVPFRQARNAAELNRALTEFKPLDLILIDTGGYSQKDNDSILQLKNMIVETPAIRPILILSCTTRDQELGDIVARFKIFNPSGLVFSKLDESTTFGCIYNVAKKTNVPLNYFTVGQRVPEDIEDSSKERVVDLILDL